MQKIAIILLTWKRISNLSKTLNRLNKQTYKDFDIFISNANKEQLSNVYKIAEQYSKLNITVYDDDNSIFTFRRLYLGKKLAESKYEIIMFIDDDVSIPTNYVELAISQYEPKSYKSVYAWEFMGSNYYNDRRRINKTNKQVNYCGTATSIIDSSIFLNDEIFNVPDKAYKIEDLWMSYFAQHKLGWKLEYLDIPNVIIGGRDEYALFREVKKDKYNKDVFLKELISTGWNFS